MVNGLSTKSPRDELEEKLGDLLCNLRPNEEMNGMISECLAKTHSDGNALFHALFAIMHSTALMQSGGLTKEIMFAVAKENESLRHLCDKYVAFCNPTACTANMVSLRKGHKQIGAKGKKVAMVYKHRGAKGTKVTNGAKLRRKLPRSRSFNFITERLRSFFEIRRPYGVN